MFGQFQCMGHHFHLILVTEIDFALRISNFHIFLELFQIFSGNKDIIWNLLLWPNSTYWAWFPFNSSHRLQFCIQIFKFFLEFFQILSENSFKFPISQIWTYGSSFPFHFHPWVHFCTQSQTIQLFLSVWNTEL